MNIMNILKILKSSFFIPLFPKEVLGEIIKTIFNKPPLSPFKKGGMILVISFFICTTSYAAEVSSEKPLTLPDCISIALENNNSIKLSNYSVQDAQAKVDAAFTQFLPKLKGKASYLRYDTVPTRVIPGLGSIPIGYQNNTGFSIELTQPLYTGGRIANYYEMTKSTYDSTQKEADAKKKDVENEVTQKYYQVLKAKKFVEIANNSRSLINSHLKNVQNFYNAGILSKNDILSVQVSLADADILLIKATNAYKLAMSALNYSLDMDLNKELNLQDIDENDISYELTLEKCTALALENREELAIINNAKNINESLINIEKSAYYPQVYFIGAYNEAGEDFPLINKNFSALFTMEVNLFNWGETSYNVESSNIALRKTEETKTIIMKSIKLEVKASYLQLEQAHEEINATKKAVEQATENYKIYSDKFSEKAATSTEVLDAKTLKLNSEINYFQALYDFHIAKANLKRAIGDMKL